MNAAEAWARCGAMALTGRPEGPPMVGPGRPAAYVNEHLEALGLPVARFAGLLGERAASAGLSRSGPWSCGGATRILPARDGHIALSLARPSDLELVPALTNGADGADAWTAITQWLSGIGRDEAEERLHLLGLPGGAVREPGEGAPLDLRPPATVRLPERPITVLDLTALWAGPLATHLLATLGARVIKVESRTRPDGARRGAPGFFALLDRGKEHLVLDLPAEADRLRALTMSADIVIESSRPRALLQMGIAASEVVESGTTWLSITARGRESNTVGFGDDVAACAGHVIRYGDDVLPVGDALADPLSGVRAAWEAVRALNASPRLVDLSMLDVARAAALGGVPDHAVTWVGGRWRVETAAGSFAVAEPWTRS